MATKNPTNVNQTIILITLLLFVLGGIATFKFALPKLHDAKVSLEEQIAKNKGLQADIGSLTQAKSQVQEAQDNLKNQLGVDPARLRYVFPPTEDVPELYLQMESIIQTAGITNPTYQINPPALDQDGLVRIPISISATGSYLDLKTFVSKLQTNIRPVSLLTASFSKAAPKEEGQSVDGLLTMTATGFVRAAALSNAYTTKTPTK